MVKVVVCFYFPHLAKHNKRSVFAIIFLVTASLLSQLPDKVADEEAVGFRALNLLYGPFAVRGVPFPECSHPKWGDYLRAVDSSKLRGTAMKSTLLVNYGRGPFSSGKRQSNIQDAASNLMDNVADDYLEEVSHCVMFDRGVEEDECRCITRDDWLDSVSQPFARVLLLVV